ncbi:GNAT family N-acetyltransferase [Methylobacterium sp. E-041]|uniref:GNAT family N-acetyltransferase n=1 Tax=unclassified Methylobacterium TaxID=2615210 RepID=UPI001FB8F01B|nr:MULTISPECIES: GNAT family N-acetyltransferase [unclassified Methylobacterium]MCJ2037374.1 GNAT family N-acetyltransferase [Methylobacterium sp. J-059]MCJ2108257.1 GNAT family N-acetyltransferase [Methylobacterium sp. E-041]
MIDRALLGRLRIEPLDRAKHKAGRAAFSSGEPRVDNFLKTNAAGLQDLETTRCVLACFPPENGEPAEIVGFYALNAHGIDTCTLPEPLRKKVGRYDNVPAVYLSVVGVHQAHQGKGIGSFLMASAFTRCAGIADQIGAAFIVLDALNEDAARLYRRLGFADLPGHEPRMLIGMKVVRAAIARTAPPAAQSA